ncbi:amidohydrolase family protein [Tenacibaculum finnmarkense genomovar finnmarkense]|uniref:amidohydrolase family protein n=1 Tax=Tenacibaculum finnmarkense TaxID=2781243 RepID=UPI001E2A1873|nr:amidohydrolase family protein [Tenacibaculum finnmarkense]MCD8417500.1 amidohydrolase family protein [Tenacibaculum finnmarkense genomovar finnmarkense]MCG8185885.1 amidohydrolase family protein [Tenacibaculum finnmarkense genomovar finnmarkense]MCG8202436.1 amidohydrolase family protein [Tenacibaculum finnmarkense genomovar finnmarkense]MCG8209928.1 amidohydrolase family protein [Tenacibaculum finnmarkense genomovar finnmarkense]MCG8212637.1 amidohydrolase family protein [Tenacibaculum fin
MKKHILTFVLVIQILVSCKQDKEKQVIITNNIAKDMVIKNVSVITMKTNKLLTDQDVVIKKGKIISISATKKTDYKNMVILNGEDKYIMPSLSDAHVHLPKNEKELEKFLTLNLINGVTKLRSMRGDWKHLEWRNKYNTKTSMYPKLYLSAPPTSRRHNFNNEQIKKYVENAKAFDFIKILSIKNETLFNTLDSLCKVNSIPIGGHFPNNISDNQLFKSNYTSFEHLAGLTGKLALLEERMQEIKKNNIFICPTLSWYSIGSGRYSYQELRSQPGMKYISKKNVDNWIEKTKQYRNKLGKQAYEKEVENELKKLNNKYQIIKKLNESGINMLLSPDSSSKYMVAGFGIVGEMKLLKNAELSNFEILKMTTVNFANFFNENYGTIEEGKDADFIILKDNPLENIDALKTIEGVFFNKNYLDKHRLDNLSKTILLN